MGHERVGFLPKSQRWRDIVEAIGHSLQSSERDSILSIAAETLECVRGRYAHIHNDKGLGAAFGFIIVLTSSSSTPGQKDLASKRHTPDAEHSQLTNISFDLTDDPSPIRLASRLNDWIRDNRGSAEYAEIARRAGADAITNWTFKQRHQPNLFGTGDTAVEIWRNAFSAESFCEISRSFFTSFTERYLRYFLEREASHRFTSIDAREQFTQRLGRHLDRVSQHAFETAKITQSFAAGWYNNHLRGRCPSDSEIRGFLRVCFQKMREELLREAAS